MLRSIAVCSLLAVAGCAGKHAPAQPQLPQIPSELAVPAGNTLDFALSARGVQIYDCKDGAWTLRGPRAELRDADVAAGTHYEGPTWQARDGSTVVAKKVASASVDASAIPWLLLQSSGHSGDGRMSKVTYVQRLQTQGGVAPASGCDAEHVETVSEVEYSALYVFYR